jgi:putative phosphoesterase
LKKIALLSDTHGFIDDQLLRHCQNSDEIWHAGDFGTVHVSDRIQSVRPLKGVYGNIDGADIRIIHPEIQSFRCEETEILMVHIGGYPDHYHPKIKEKIITGSPAIFISGHSHILKIQRDVRMNNMLHINPGAAGKHGFHKVRTMVRLKIEGKRIFDVEVIELGKK